MHAPVDNKRYLVITPVKDESEFILQTITSVINQTIKPICWVIVDDGSTDNTVSLIKPFLGVYEWIYLITNRRDSRRLTGTAEAAAFKAGLESVKDLGYDFIVKLDGDVVLERDYFEKLLSEFEEDKDLGIASGCYLERDARGWVTVEMPEYHAAGATKVLRKMCFEEIGGFLTVPGWDTVDEIKALYLGWRTRHFKDIKFFHLRAEGSGMGALETNRMHGEIFYLTGGGKLFFLLKLMHRMFFTRPFILGGVMMLAGYLKPMLMRRRLLVTKNEARFYRRMLNRRILLKAKSFILNMAGSKKCAESAEFMI